MGRVSAAIVSGYALIMVLVLITARLFLLVPGFNSANPPFYYFVVSLVTDIAYAIAGGYACSWIAGEGSKQATVGLIVLAEVMGLISQLLLWHTMPHWFEIGLLVGYPIGIWAGSKLRPVAITAI